ncbi:hypothetical protein CPB85DRAFT_1321839 [Mucidula mucida]|nr:hypothetical protein CPB85DRAFT_1321839 [Mucidula mucida]
MAAELERLRKLCKELLDKPWTANSSDGEDVVVAAEPKEALTSTDTLAFPEDSSDCLDASVGLELSNVGETDAQTSTTHVSSLFDALYDEVDLFEPDEGDSDALVDPYTQPLPSLTATSSLRYALTSEETAATFNDAAPEAHHAIPSQEIQTSVNGVKAPFGAAGYTAPKKQTCIPFLDWYQRPLYQLPPRAATQSFNPPAPGAKIYLTIEQSLLLSLGFEYNAATGDLDEPLEWFNSGFELQSYSHDEGSFDLRKEQSHGSIGPIRTTGNATKGSTKPYKRLQVSNGSGSGKESDLTARPLVTLTEITAPHGKTKRLFLPTAELRTKYPHVHPSAFYIFEWFPLEYYCPAVPDCTHRMPKDEIARHGGTHIDKNDGMVTVTDGENGTKSIQQTSFYKDVVDRQTKHVCPYCDRRVMRSEKSNVCRHFMHCTSLPAVVAAAVALRGN